MRHPMPVDDQDTFTLNEEPNYTMPGWLEPATRRTVSCNACDLFSCGVDLWVGGRVDRRTHVRILREDLAWGCKRNDCKHPKEGIHRDTYPTA